MSERSWGGAKYILIFTDNFSRTTFDYFLNTKGETGSTYKYFKKMVKNQTGIKIKRLQSDNGTKFCNNSFSHLLKSKSILRKFTVPYTPEQNGIQERTNQTVVVKARSMLLDLELPNAYCGKTVSTDNYLKNRWPSTAIKEVTPEEL